MSKELVLLGDFYHTGTLSAGGRWTPSAREGRAELDTDEMAEVVFVEIRSPLNPDGTPQDIGALTFILDEQDISQYVRLPMRDDWNVFPPRRYVHASEYIYFGDPIWKVQGPTSMVDATTLKYRERIRPVVFAAGTDVTAPFRIRLYGHRYTDRSLGRILQAQSLPGGVEIVDKARSRSFSAAKGASLPISRATWLQLPGGPKQEKPIIMPYWRYSRNRNATQLNVGYEFRFDVGLGGVPNVYAEEEELFWRYDTEKKALLLRGVGVRGHANAGAWWLQMTGDPEQKEHPKGRIPFTDRNNEYHFGRSYPVWGDASLPPVYYSLRRFADYQALIAGEKAYLTFVDGGQAVVPADGVVFMVNGVLIELREDQGAGVQAA